MMCAALAQAGRFCMFMGMAVLAAGRGRGQGVHVGGCSTGLDCSLNGVCPSTGGGSCVCDPGWSGPQCATLALGPVAPSQGKYAGGVYAMEGGPFATTSWGGNAIFDNATELWHLCVHMAPHPTPF